MVYYARSPQTETSYVGDRVVIFDRSSQKSLVLNPTGAQLWKSLSKPHSIQQLVDVLTLDDPTLDSKSVSADVEHYVDELSQLGVVSVVDAG